MTVRKWTYENQDRSELDIRINIQKGQKIKTKLNMYLTDKYGDYFLMNCPIDYKGTFQWIKYCVTVESLCIRI